MANWKPIKITKKGQALMMKILNGATGIKFTKVESSNTQYGDNELESLTVLDNIKQTVEISKVVKNDDGSITATAVFDNKSLSDAYYMRTLGIIATDPDDGEILYGVTSADEPNYFPSGSEKSSSSATFNLTVSVGNTDDISVTVSGSANATVEQLESVKSYLSASISSVDSRISNIVANTGNSNTEIVDARLGTNGVTYTTLGDAIRTQMKKKVTMLDLFRCLESVQNVLQNVLYKSSNTDAYNSFASLVASVKPEDAVSATYNLTNCKISSHNPYYSKGDAYSATVTVNESCDFESITVLMGGTDVTSTVVSDKTITISSITGNIVITATAKSRYLADGIKQLSYVYSADTGDAYIDTGWQMTSLSEKIVVGFGITEGMLVNASTQFGHVTNFMGVEADTNFGGTTYSNVELGVYSDNSNKTITTSQIGMAWFTGNSAANTFKSKYNSTFADAPYYVSLTDGAQGIYTDEALSTMYSGQWSKASYSLAGTASKIPPFNFWLFRSNIQDVAYQSAQKKTWRCPGVKIYCFKVYDADDNLVVNMRPAKRESDSVIGLYDTVRKQFYTNACTTGELKGE